MLSLQNCLKQSTLIQRVEQSRLVTSYALSRLFSTTDKDSLPYVTDKSENPQKSLPTVSKRGAWMVKMERGKTYFYCTCGNSKLQPWCDGSHQGTEWRPYKFTYDGEAKVKGICGCKMNRDDSGEKCDRSHRVFHFDAPEQYKPDFRRDPHWLNMWNIREDLKGRPK